MPIDHGTSNEFRTTLGARTENLTAYRNFVVEACRRTQVSDEITFSLKLSIDEACTNIIEHGYHNSGDGTITIEFYRQPDRVVIELIDHGTPFHPDDAVKIDPTAPIDKRRIGGLGIFLMKKTLDEIKYVSDPTMGNRLTLIKYLKTGV